MKLHWWIFGTMLAVASSVVVLRRLTNGRKHDPPLSESEKEIESACFLPGIFESEFDGVDFLA